ncbi:Asp-tRNA(Asn)/Glu-tRNA(Gln) amidotransferase subunit GatB [Alkaliphilus transvaalensis]|uniref:Asp-tRNA(Asn)/Glu-tRNA(Gln) amidotransferase subunit GatB n=1 Tax=Alkaliphilus transvaalensis TaxID=114628 RepID=UPI00047D5847|nr:Asp-tRNA(Asn)/Glu-tRNA(Gln) amidotransferase subunit GatB [Alkaliphilus transvaalensis]
MAWETIIGMEIHVELATKSKIFCSCPTTFGAPPNSQTCPVCLGLPGTLPVLNDEVVKLAIKAGLALNCDINLSSKMDRKNYFYPDSPKAYQISQYDLPICSGGRIEIEVEGKKKEIRINRIHIEEDAGKLIHMVEEPHSLIDYNRVGVPLIEIVSEADMRSPQEAVEYVKTLKSILEYAGISDCRMEQGSLRCDANISIRRVGQEELNSKVEIKNMNSFKELIKAMEKEEKRQRELYSFGEGHKVIQETRRWDSGKGRTVSMRTKEDAHDYRYFPEPDIPTIHFNRNLVESIEKMIPELPEAKKKRFKDFYQLTDKEIEILIGDKPLAEFYERTVKVGAEPKIVANWILGDLLKLLKVEELQGSEIPIKEKDLVELLKLIETGEISGKIAKEVFETMFKTREEPKSIIAKRGLTQISGEEQLERYILEVLENNPQSVEDYHGGKKQAMGYLMGQIMKATQGQANPQLTKEILTMKLQNLK